MRQALAGYAAFISFNRLTIAGEPEQYVRIPARRVANLPGCRLVVTGRIDVVCSRQTDREDDSSTYQVNLSQAPICLDVKTGRLQAQTADDLADAPSSWVYQHLMAYAYGHGDCEIAQLQLLDGTFVSTHLSSAQIDAGKNMCRDMIAAVQSQVYTPTPGAHCGYCPNSIQSVCPTQNRAKPGWEGPF